MTAPEGLEPPPDLNKADPGAHQLPEPETSDSEDQFTDAHSGPITPRINSPIPRTQVEKAGGGPRHVEVPTAETQGTREAEAQPDEVAAQEGPDGAGIPLDTPKQEIPITVWESLQSQESTSLGQSLSSNSDAGPDVVVELQNEDNDGGPDGGEVAAGPVEQENDDFGDDFDDFEEGGQDDDFDDFEGGFQQPQPVTTVPQGSPSAQLYTVPFPVPDFDGLGPDEVLSATKPCLDHLFPPDELDPPPPPTLHQDASVFLTPRSASLWSQLVAPPPLAPPDWIRSRTRRLFLVSLGVPVDLDEILPASKQKKLILPSLKFRTTSSPRTSSDSRSVSRLRQGEGNASSTSVDTQGRPTGSKSRKGPPPAPELDLVAARYLCMTTDEALDGMTDDELSRHVAKLEAMQGTANQVLEYWRKRTDEKIGDREAFEGVIENLVKHARKVRK